MYFYFQEEVSKTKTLLEKDLDSPVSLKMALNVPILNALWRIMTGKTLDYNDEALMELIHKIERLFSSTDTNVRGIMQVLCENTVNYFFSEPRPDVADALVEIHLS